MHISHAPERVRFAAKTQPGPFARQKLWRGLIKYFKYVFLSVRCIKQWQLANQRTDERACAQWSAHRVLLQVELFEIFAAPDGLRWQTALGAALGWPVAGGEHLHHQFHPVIRMPPCSPVLLHYILWFRSAKRLPRVQGSYLLQHHFSSELLDCI